MKPSKPNSGSCWDSQCRHYQKQSRYKGFRCSLTGDLPSNMGVCPLTVKPEPTYTWVD